MCVCIACGCHLFYKLERGQNWSGSAAGSPRSTLCCRKALYTQHIRLSLAFSHPVIQQRILARPHPGVTPALPMEGFSQPAWPPLARCHGAIREPSSHQIYFLPLCGFPKRQIRGSATEKPFGIFIHVKTCTERGACLGSMPCRRLPFVSPNKSTAPVQRDPGIWINHGYQLGNSLWAQVQSVPDD